jgi:hypothetical protein
MMAALDDHAKGDRFTTTCGVGTLGIKHRSWSVVVQGPPQETVQAFAEAVDFGVSCGSAKDQPCAVCAVFLRERPADAHGNHRTAVKAALMVPSRKTWASPRWPTAGAYRASGEPSLISPCTSTKE